MRVDTAVRRLREHLARVPSPVWLGLSMAAYFVASFALSWTRALELHATTWDLGIYQQALWSTGQGRPFYEAPDLETGGYETFLEVHTTFVLYALVPLYRAFPAETTLFAVQSAVVAVAAVPLYALTVSITGSTRRGLLAAVVYLAWAPTLASNLYDFHVEAFLPLETFAFVLAWERGRYALGFLVAAIAFLTFEITPILLFFVGVFFLLPSWAEVATGAETVRALPGLRARGEAVWRGARAALRRPRVRASLGLLLACVIAYDLLVRVQTTSLAESLGLPAPPSYASGYIVGTTPGALGLAVANLSQGFAIKAATWVLLLALLGFVPLRAPRTLVLAAPWAVFAFFSASTNYSVLGFQYGFIEASALLVGFAYGLARWPAVAAVVPSEAPGPRPATSVRDHARRPRAVARLTYVAILGLLVANLALSPADPLMTPSPLLGNAYGVTYAVTPGFGAVEHLVALVPSGATVVASDNLFPLVANDVHAYSFFWTENDFLHWPFDAAHLPPYVLIAQNRTDAVPTWLVWALGSPSEYGVRGVAWSTPAGAVMLFEQGYDGTPAAFGASPSLPATYAGESLGPQQQGYVVPDPSARFGNTVDSDPGATGTIWYGPNVALPAGTYRATIWVRAFNEIPSDPVPGGQTVVTFDGWAYAWPTLFSESVPFAAIDGPTWTALNFTFELPEPVLSFTMGAYSQWIVAGVSTEYVSVAPIPAG